MNCFASGRDPREATACSLEPSAGGAGRDRGRGRGRGREASRSEGGNGAHLGGYVEGAVRDVKVPDDEDEECHGWV